MDRGVYKVVFLGEGGVGKTSLVKRAIEGDFDPNMKLTVGVDIAVCDVNAGNWRATYQLWDLGGQVRFRDLATTFSSGAHLAIAVFDVANRFSFFKLEEWIGHFLYINPDSPIIVVGNKIDLRDDRYSNPSLTIIPNEGRDFADRFNAPYIETSALSGQSIEEILGEATQILMKRYPTRPDPIENLRRMRRPIPEFH